MTSSVGRLGDKRKSSWQPESTSQKGNDYKATTLPRRSSLRAECPNVEAKPPASSSDTGKTDKKHVSVKDLSRQFERQLSEQSDTSRTSTLSRSSGWSCASDLANGNRALDGEQANQNSLNRNTATQNWTTIL
ncbi:hypothetical protein LSH36_291g07013 [Paralvinella palmiformis]|uniref:Uncharacterized protein n=1 Tax=Paralvinella palmiformis TaxID=53620 RepID=A0AAD9N3G5_9ANNE|nr:hypothetical protein LSH36_291g07013 [Paralvinella palmiformis]